ncbi:MAG: rod shape-determining protein MreD [Synergistetes bacterium]|nr:rod shape-determining protein MreD [Synergistota bacterium]
MVLRIVVWSVLLWLAISLESSWIYYVSLKRLGIDVVFAVLFYLSLVSQNRNYMAIIGFLVGTLTDAAYGTLIGLNALVYSLAMFSVTHAKNQLSELSLPQLLKLSLLAVLLKEAITISIMTAILGYKIDMLNITKESFFNLIAVLFVSLIIHKKEQEME